jgi:hypothetical protein
MEGMLAAALIPVLVCRRHRLYSTLQQDMCKGLVVH